MTRLRKTFSALLGQTRREKRGTIMVALILISIISTRYYLNSDISPVIEITQLYVEEGSDGYAGDSSNYSGLFRFNPNTADRDHLLALGLSDKQASTLINFRNAGAVFRRADDLYKVYGLDSLLIARLEPYVFIADTLPADQNNEETHYNKVYKKADESTSEKSVLISDLNSCTASELEALPGIGKVLSERIIRYRSLLGGFVSPCQLSEVYGLDTTYLEVIYSLVRLNSDSVRTLRLDSCTYAQLARHPYIGSQRARAIVKYRDLMGAPESIHELVDQKVIDSAAARRIQPYCFFADTSSGSRDTFRNH